MPVNDKPNRTDSTGSIAALGSTLKDHKAELAAQNKKNRTKAYHAMCMALDNAIAETEKGTVLTVRAAMAELADRSRDFLSERDRQWRPFAVSLRNQRLEIARKLIDLAEKAAGELSFSTGCNAYEEQVKSLKEEYAEAEKSAMQRAQRRKSAAEELVRRKLALIPEDSTVAVRKSEAGSTLQILRQGVCEKELSAEETAEYAYYDALLCNLRMVHTDRLENALQSETVRLLSAKLMKKPCFGKSMELLAAKGPVAASELELQLRTDVAEYYEGRSASMEGIA